MDLEFYWGGIVSVDVLFEKKGWVGVIIFNWLKVLNVFNYGMVIVIVKILVDWEMDDDVVCVIVLGIGEKVFCVGGDICSIYDVRLVGDIVGFIDFFWDEYLLNV